VATTEATPDYYDIYVQIANRFQADVGAKMLRRVAAEVLRQEGVEEGTEMSLIITSDEAIQELNLRFRGVDAPTDVLAFGMGDEGGFVTAPESFPYLGDVVISYERAIAQAEEWGHSIAEELKLLIVHGILHLLGYDHEEEADAQKMREREAQICRIVAWPDGHTP